MLFSVMILVLLFGCSDNLKTEKSSALNVPTHYQIEKTAIGSSTGQGWTHNLNYEIKNGVVTGTMTTNWQDVTGGKTSCNAEYLLSGEDCWKGLCYGEERTWKCSGGYYPETYEEILVEIMNHEELIPFLSNQECNEQICFENNHLSYLSIGSRFSKTWRITVLS